jgi:hypothetical protein
MEIIFELLFELVFQFLAEVLGNLGIEAIDRVLSNRVARGITGAILAIGVGFGVGWWWGNRHVAIGNTDVPNSLFISIGLAILFAVLCGVAAIREFSTSDRPEVVHPPFWSADRWLPWRWPPGRLAGFALLNASIAIGITVGFTPEEVRLR